MRKLYNETTQRIKDVPKPQNCLYCNTEKCRLGTGKMTIFKNKWRSQ